MKIRNYLLPPIITAIALIVVYIGQTLYDRSIDITLAADQLNSRSDIYIESQSIKGPLFGVLYVAIIMLGVLWTAYRTLRKDTVSENE